MTPEEAAQLVPVLEQQERDLVLPRFDHDVAWDLGCHLAEMARERRAPVVVVIWAGDQRLFHCGLEGSSADNDAWAERKRRVVVRWGQSSYLVGTRFRAKGTTFEESSRVDKDLYAAHGGAFPLRCSATGGCVIGTVAVSGLPQADDHDLVVAGLRSFLAL